MHSEGIVSKPRVILIDSFFHHFFEGSLGTQNIVCVDVQRVDRLKTAQMSLTAVET